jgi:hypothetical protein
MQIILATMKLDRIRVNGPTLVVAELVSAIPPANPVYLGELFFSPDECDALARDLLAAAREARATAEREHVAPASEPEAAEPGAAAVSGLRTGPAAAGGLVRRSPRRGRAAPDDAPRLRPPR